jgi:hypothetical protein
MPCLIDLTEKRFGRLVVLQRTPCDSSKPKWDCQCDCGNVCVARGEDLRSERHQSCGCLQRERVTKHGHSSLDPKKVSATYRTWLGMVQRCTNPNARGFRRYGGRGISLCDRWRRFELFLKDMGERPQSKSLDRIDTNGPYSRENCRWATRKEQARNSKANRIIIHQGQSRCLTEWAEIKRLSVGAICHRLQKGWTIAETLETPATYFISRDAATGRFLPLK